MDFRYPTVAALLLLLAAPAAAQPPQFGAPSRPTFSPYLNLARPGVSPALNYYGLVRPEVQAQQAIQNLQGAVTTNQQAIGGLQTGADLPGTGHQTMFMNYGGYFQTNRGGQGGGFGGGPGGGRAGAQAFSGGLNRPSTGGSTAPRR